MACRLAPLSRDPGRRARAFINDAAASVDIHGLRFNFMAGNETGWQNPAHPLIEVPFQVQRRTDLRTGEPVPTTRSDQDPAPGETDAGVFVDTVEVEGELVLVGPTNRLTDDDTADDNYTYEHLTVGVPPLAGLGLVVAGRRRKTGAG